MQHVQYLYCLRLLHSKLITSASVRCETRVMRLGIYCENNKF
ncbi:unnamed protein product [Rodentolepis nana]|uniref:Uncharacterized protein n=1 Tax=Rodentolepis nana TaxID=102285 RepID=A0A3P7SNF1_RODNA|nr:unnamed protein product [Rodentolepis nana]